MTHKKDLEKYYFYLIMHVLNDVVCLIRSKQHFFYNETHSFPHTLTTTQDFGWTKNMQLIIFIPVIVSVCVCGSSKRWRKEKFMKIRFWKIYFDVMQIDGKNYEANLLAIRGITCRMVVVLATTAAIYILKLHILNV